MNNYKRIKLLLSASLLTLFGQGASHAGPTYHLDTLASCFSFSNNPAQCYSSNGTFNETRIISDQTTRQIVRQISGYITSRIERDINPAFFGPSMQITQGASADGKSLTPDSVWEGFSWSRLSNDSNANGSFDTDIYQSTTGIDKKIGNFYFGTTLNYAGSSSDINHHTTESVNGSNHNVGLTPYMAYVFNKNFFVSALSGYMYSTSSYQGALPVSQAHAYQTEIDLNGLHVIDQWFMKAKVGTRYLHTHTELEVPNTGLVFNRSNQDGWTYLLDAEGGYAFKSGLRAYTGILYEYNNASHSNPTLTGIINTAGKSTFYYSAGVDYSVNKKLTLGTKVQTDLNNRYVDLTTVTLTARLWFD